MNTDKLMELERKWRERGKEYLDCQYPSPWRIERALVLDACADELAALRAEQAVGEEQIARELLAEAERGPIYEYGTVHRRVAHDAIRRALGTARQSEGSTSKEAWWSGARAALGVAADMPRQEVGELIAARQSEGVVPKTIRSVAEYEAAISAGAIVEYAKSQVWIEMPPGSDIAGCLEIYELRAIAAATGGEGEG